MFISPPVCGSLPHFCPNQTLPPAPGGRSRIHQGELVPRVQQLQLGQEIQSPRPALLSAPKSLLHQHPMRNPKTSHCRSAWCPLLPRISKARPLLSLALYSQHLKCAAQPGGTHSCENPNPAARDGHTYAPEGLLGLPVVDQRSRRDGRKRRRGRRGTAVCWI